MKQKRKWLLSTAGALSLAVVSSSAFAAMMSENRVDYSGWGDEAPTGSDILLGYPAVTFTDIAISYQNGRMQRHGGAGNRSFTGESTSTSVFTLWGEGLYDDVNPYDGYQFAGTMSIDVQYTEKGLLNPGEGSFSIYSDDAVFQGSDHCDTDGMCLVYGGDLAKYGWSSNHGFFEFEGSNYSGWAEDKWAPAGHRDPFALWVRTRAMGGHHMDGMEYKMHTGDGHDGVMDLMHLSDYTSKGFHAMVNGIAVVPVPAAVWLFGSGLLGLVGVARRKQIQAA